MSSASALRGSSSFTWWFRVVPWAPDGMDNPIAISVLTDRGVDDLLRGHRVGASWGDLHAASFTVYAITFTAVRSRQPRLGHRRGSARSHPSQPPKPSLGLATLTLNERFIPSHRRFRGAVTGIFYVGRSQREPSYRYPAPASASHAHHHASRTRASRLTHPPRGFHAPARANHLRNRGRGPITPPRFVWLTAWRRGANGQSTPQSASHSPCGYGHPRRRAHVIRACCPHIHSSDPG